MLSLGISATPIQAIDELIADAHLDDVGFNIRLRDQSLETVLMPDVPLLFRGGRPPMAMPPRLGEHGREILRECGVDDATIDQALAISTAAMKVS